MEDESLIRVPGHLKSLGGVFQKLLDTVDQCCSDVSGSRAVDYGKIERVVGDAAAEVERASHAAVLSVAAPVAPCIEIGGEAYVQAVFSRGTYYTLAGPVEVPRWLYRRRGNRGGATVDPICIRTGALPDGWLPQTAAAMAYHVQEMPSRVAVECAQKTGRLPYCRASFERVLHEVGSAYRAHHADIEDVLIADYELPEEAASVSASLDRTSVPMEEPRPRPPGQRRKKGEPKNPVAREFRMAWCATVTIHDGEGDALDSIRYACMPGGDQIALCEGMASDVDALLKKNSRLKVATLADGAPDVLALLEEHISKKAIGRDVHHLVDFWHVTEYLAEAAKVISGDDAHRLIARWKKILCEDTDGVTKVLRDLRRSDCAEVRVGDSAPVADAIRYIENHRDLMNYAAARRAHLPIGSGNVEATCKTLIGVRMKRCGSRWKERTGEDVVRLRALALSDRWDAAMKLTFERRRSAVRRAA